MVILLDSLYKIVLLFRFYLLPVPFLLPDVCLKLSGTSADAEILTENFSAITLTMSLAVSPGILLRVNSAIPSEVALGIPPEASLEIPVEIILGAPLGVPLGLLDFYSDVALRVPPEVPPRVFA